MRVCLLGLIVAAWAGSANAADTPQYAAAPAWVTPMAIAKPPANGDTEPVRVLLLDFQDNFGLDEDDYYTESAIVIQSPEGLSGIGSLTFEWNPTTEGLVINRIELIRDGKTINLLTSGQPPSVLRRETNLERAELDGVLTATLQPEGLRVGDILHVATTLKRHDPLLQGHSATVVVNADRGQVDHFLIRSIWPAGKPLHWRVTDGLHEPAIKTTGTGSELTLDMHNVQPARAPAGAPARFSWINRLELSDFGSWGDISTVMWPLYQKAMVLKPNSPLKDEVAKIRSASSDPKIQAAMALRLVEDQIRYFALAIDHGNYTPADADLTWSRRFGDCKGKTVLLLALLHELGIDARPALVSTAFGDGLDERLPMPVFDHVIVRAAITNKVYWLDGTRQGDRSLDNLPIPNFRWALPLRAAGAKLEKLVPLAPSEPWLESSVALDASGGLDAPAPAHAEHILRGDIGIAAHMGLNAGGTSLDQILKAYWRRSLPWIEPKQVSMSYDDTQGVTHLIMEGSAKMDWAADAAGREFVIGDSTLGYNHAFKREPGSHEDAPFAVPFPISAKWTVTVRLPNGGTGFQLLNAGDVDQTLAGMMLHRRSRLDRGVVTMEHTERAIVAEFPASEAEAASTAGQVLWDHPVTVRAPRNDLQPPAASSAVQDLREKLQTLADRAANGDIADLLPQAKALTSAAAFAELTPAERKSALLVTAYAALQAGDGATALSASKQLTDLDPNTERNWTVRLAAASRLKDFSDADVDLANLITSWPDYLTHVTDNQIFSVHANSQGEAEFQLLKALYAAHWKPKSPFRDASGFWLSLARFMIDSGDFKGAAAVAQQINGYDALIGMHADRRFDPIVRADPARFDVKAAIDKNLADLTAAAAAAPDKLEGVNAVAVALLARNRPEDALALTDSALSSIRTESQTKPPFSDMDDQLNWTLNLRASALMRLGRTDQGLREYEQAAMHQERGVANVSQVLNLSAAYNSLGRPQDALDLIENFDETNTSPIGKIVLETELACAYAQLNNSARLHQALAYVREHVADNPGGSYTAMLCARDDDGVARSVIAGLTNLDTRTRVLTSLQDYLRPPHATLFEQDQHNRWLAVRARPDVQSAIAKFGRIAAYDVVN